MSRFLISVSIIATALFAPVIHAADEPDAPVFSFSGFGTLGVVHSSEDQADFTASVLKPDGAGYTHAWSADVDSLIGAQLIVNLNSKLSAVVQVISEQDPFGTYDPHVEWANVQYQFTPDFSIRVGRTVLPVFFLTATRKVGYTFPWVRPPLEVYRILPVSSNDGADISYRLSTGGLISTFQANAGGVDSKSPTGDFKARRGWGFSYTAEYGSMTARATWQNANVTVASINSLFEAFRQFGPQGIAIADSNDVDDKRFSTVAVGASYDPGQWFVTSEWGSSHSHTVLGKIDAWYVSGGYRFGEFTPYLTYAESRPDNLSDPGLTVSALPPYLAGPATGLNAALNGILSSKPAQNTTSVGIRWDFLKNFDLKLQFDHIEIGDGSTGTFINPQPGYQLGGDANLFAATIDFVF
jgi:hypothetical protein